MESSYYGFIYITTNTINGMRYIGMNSSFNKYYLGSGKYLLCAVKKYGRDNFIVKPIYYAKTKDELVFAERLFKKQRMF